jgi:hypothetical protein
MKLISPVGEPLALIWAAILLTFAPPVVWGQNPIPSTVQTAATGPLPKTIDLRPLMKEWGLVPRLQGDRPTCSVFTMANALEFGIARRNGHVPRLSVEFLNWAGNRAAGEDNDGGFFSDLWNGFARYGICSEEEFAYQPAFDAHRAPDPVLRQRAEAMKSLGLRLNWIKPWDVKTGLTSAHLLEIRRTLSRGWPVCGGFRWPKQARWENDVLQMCSADTVYDGHSVLLVGYEDDNSQPGGGILRFRNTSGGKDGAMPYAYAEAYMNDAAWVVADDPVPGAASPAPRTESVPALFRDPLGSLAVLPSGRNRRISSNEQPKWNDGNFDMTMLPPGKVFELPLLQGPGVITHIWLTSHAGRVNELNALSLRIYWDGREQPEVEVPLGEFFAVGQGKPAVVESLPVQVSPTGALVCYWRMPFARSARIVVANDNPDRTTGLYWQVDWTQLPELPPATPYFHACYRQEYPAVAGHDYLIADLDGTGQYVGTVMSVTLGQDGWWGEGDDFFFIDGESVPSLQGTGSEDYFNDAWGFRPRTSHWFGQPRWQGDNAGDSGVCYRWHVLDPVAFSRSLKVTLEHKGNHPEDIEGFYLERPDFINSIAFWYQIGEPKKMPGLPPYPERRVPWQFQHLVRAFKQATSTGSAKVQIETSGMFGARPLLSWRNTEPGARLTLPFSVEAAGRFAVRLTAASAPEFGRYAIELDGEVALPSADFGSADPDELDLSLGTHQLTKGSHSLTFRALSCPDGAARPVAVEMLRLLPLPKEANRAVKNENEAHFIRLAIGRATYAYRLAYGQLPESLEMLVKAGLLETRFLTDENGIPLHSKRDGEYLAVESVGPGAWQHRWQGLDARR